MIKILIFLLLIMPFWGAAQKISDLSTEELIADFEYFQKALEKYNPTMYVYHPKSDFENLMKEIKKNLILKYQNHGTLVPLVEYL